MGLGLLSFGSPFLPSWLYLLLSRAGSTAQTGFALGLTHPGWLEGAEGFSSPFPVTAAEMLVFSGKVAVKPERTPGSLWVKAALWFSGKLLPLGCPCSLGAAWRCQAEAGSPCSCWETISFPPQLFWFVWGRLQSCLACAFCGKTLTCPSPVTCLAALLVVQTCSAKEGEG